ncbi:hypothetical protein HHX47_DHR1000291 [Lentinula edodes]|nr:hypothetical protein HHX47_DHR1000291 [Lentinula edodes]
MPSPLSEVSEATRAKWVITLIVSLIQYITLGVAMYLTPFYSKEDMYTSSLTGKKWLEELLVGHPGRAYIALGMRRHAEDPLPGQRRQQEIDFGSLATSEKISRAEKRRAEIARDRLANEMWENYLSILEEYHKQGGVDAMDVDEDEMEIAPLD